MIIFYDKNLGNIIGTIDGRVHGKEQLGMFLGSRDTNDRLIVQWKPVKFYNKMGKEVPVGDTEIYTADFEPDHVQKDIFIELDKKPISIYEYKVNIVTKLLEKKP